MAGPEQRPEGALIEKVMRQRSLRPPDVAHLADITPERWRQIMNGYAAVGQGKRIEVIGPKLTIAKMARAVGATPQQLEQVGRPDAAEVLRELNELEPEPLSGLDVRALRAIADNPNRPAHLRRMAEGLIPMVEAVLASEEEFRAEERGKTG